eukprot:896445_1
MASQQSPSHAATQALIALHDKKARKSHVIVQIDWLSLKLQEIKKFSSTKLNLICEIYGMEHLVLVPKRGRRATTKKAKMDFIWEITKKAKKEQKQPQIEAESDKAECKQEVEDVHSNRARGSSRRRRPANTRVTVDSVDAFLPEIPADLPSSYPQADDAANNNDDIDQLEYDENDQLDGSQSPHDRSQSRQLQAQANEVEILLKLNKLERHWAVLFDNGCDTLAVCKCLGHDELKEIGLRCVGDRIKLMNVFKIRYIKMIWKRLIHPMRMRVWFRNRIMDLMVPVLVCGSDQALLKLKWMVPSNGPSTVS